MSKMKQNVQISSDDEEVDVESPSVKKRRKKKSPRGKRSKVKKEEVEQQDEEDDAVASSVQKYVEQLSQGLGLLTTPPKQTKKKIEKKDSESSGEEERWLDAIQSGKLEEVDEELKKVKPKDPKLMTARQRAMFERKSDQPPGEQLLSLPSGYKEVVMTAEAIQRKALKSQKRKEKADEKREKDKKKTMERLLKKQESKTIRGSGKRSSRRNVPQITYRLTANGPCLILPPATPFPLAAKRAPAPPALVKCGVRGCSNPKRYSCRITNIPLCSLQCYNKNRALTTK